ncbi:hypothetical protein C7212DRAFT_331756, partial [Tuber magnatum]
MVRQVAIREQVRSLAGWSPVMGMSTSQGEPESQKTLKREPSLGIHYRIFPLWARQMWKKPTCPTGAKYAYQNKGLYHIFWVHASGFPKF